MDSGIPILGTYNLGVKLGKPGEIMGLKRDSKLYFDVQMLELILKRLSRNSKIKNWKLISKMFVRIK